MSRALRTRLVCTTSKSFAPPSEPLAVFGAPPLSFISTPTAVTPGHGGGMSYVSTGHGIAHA
eukprot:607965-Rhodomonas_salina.2